MILYLDTSSLLKLYVEEAYSVDVRRWVSDSAAVATSVVGYPEAMSALARRQRDGDLDEESFRTLICLLDEEWANSYVIVDVAERHAGELAWRRRLRGFDAVHLAAALEVHAHHESLKVCFSSFDKKLNQAAAAEGLKVLAPAGLLP